MKYVFHEYPEKIRREFAKHFVMTWDEFHAIHPQYYDITWYENAFLWDIMSPEFPKISFKSALEKLRLLNCEVVVMSEKIVRNYFGRGMVCDGEDMDEFVICCNSASLADVVERDWLGAFEADLEERSFTPVLPPEIYVFDEDMKWFVVFTHEFDEVSEDVMANAATRLCISCGF